MMEKLPSVSKGKASGKEKKKSSNAGKKSKSEGNKKQSKSDAKRPKVSQAKKSKTKNEDGKKGRASKKGASSSSKNEAGCLSKYCAGRGKMIALLVTLAVIYGVIIFLIVERVVGIWSCENDEGQSGNVNQPANGGTGLNNPGGTPSLNTDGAGGSENQGTGGNGNQGTGGSGNQGTGGSGNQGTGGSGNQGTGGSGNQETGGGQNPQEEYLSITRTTPNDPKQDLTFLWVICQDLEPDSVWTVAYGYKVKCGPVNWTVIQYRTQESFNFVSRSWAEYRDGFGTPSGEFWFGLAKVFQYVQYKHCLLRIEVEDVNGLKVHNEYDGFSLTNEAGGYSLHLKNMVSGSGPDPFKLGLSNTLNSAVFSAADRNTAGSTTNCAPKHGGWWWPDSGSCDYSFLNGPFGTSEGIRWPGINAKIAKTSIMFKCHQIPLGYNVQP